MITADLKGVIVDHNEDNWLKNLFSEGDWKHNPSRKLIQKWEISNDQEFKFISLASKASNKFC